MAHRFAFVPRWLDPLLLRRGILLNRDSSRVPMPWTSGEHAGFSPQDSKPPWLPVHPASAQLNVAAQREDPSSLPSWYRMLLHLRRDRSSLRAGRLALDPPTRASRDVLVYRRFSGPRDRVR